MPLWIKRPSSWYYLFYIAYFIAFHTVYIVIRDHAFPKGWNLLTPIACLAGAIIVLSPVLVPMVKMAIGSAWVYASGVNDCVADVSGYVIFPPVSSTWWPDEMISIGG